MQATTITEVISLLDDIIEQSEKGGSTMGYFAALYQRVTIAVKEKLGTSYFQDDARMEQLDVVFANRYLKAYAQFKNQQATTLSWKAAFDAAPNDKLIILQHLLLGMNAHINLDLGIAAAEISTPKSIDELENDFNKINEILASLVDEVKNKLIKVWPLLPWILRRLRGWDNHIMDFSMEVARDGAWEFAKEMVQKSDSEIPEAIANRDRNVAQIAELITNRNFIDGLLFKLIRFGEIGSVSEKINSLQSR